MSTLYHGTKSRNARAIEVEGWLGSELSTFTDGFSHVENGVVFLTDDIEEAKSYGDVVIEVHLEGVEFFPFDDGFTKPHFYAYANDINENSWWEVIN